MNLFKITRSQFYVILAFTAVVPLLALVAGFNLALQYNDSKAQSAETPVLDEMVVELTEELNAVQPAILVTDTDRTLNNDTDTVDNHTEYLETSFDDKGSDIFEYDSSLILVVNDVSTPEVTVAPEEDQEGTPELEDTLIEATNSDRYLLQTAAFSKKDSALRLAKDLSAKHSEVQIFSKDAVMAESPLLYVVTLGHFNSKVDAKSAASEIKTRFELPVYVTERATLNAEIFADSLMNDAVAMR